MEIVSLIPGATTAGDAITITTGAPDIDAVVAAEIERMPHCLADHAPAAIVAALNVHTAANVLGAIGDHPAADIQGALADHSAVLLAACFGNHTQAQVADAVLAHVVHAHNLVIAAGGGGAPADVFGAVVGGTAHICAAAANLIPGGVAATGIQNYTTPAHAVGANPLAHVGVADLAHVGGANPVDHPVGGAPLTHTGTVVDVGHAGGSPVVAATPAKDTTRTITLSVDTLLGDILTLFYLAVGERVLAS